MGTPRAVRYHFDKDSIKVSIGGFDQSDMDINLDNLDEWDEKTPSMGAWPHEDVPLPTAPEAILTDFNPQRPCYLCDIKGVELFKHPLSGIFICYDCAMQHLQED